MSSYKQISNKTSKFYKYLFKKTTQTTIFERKKHFFIQFNSFCNINKNTIPNQSFKKFVKYKQYCFFQNKFVLNHFFLIIILPIVKNIKFILTQKRKEAANERQLLIHKEKVFFMGFTVRLHIGGCNQP